MFLIGRSAVFFIFAFVANPSFGTSDWKAFESAQWGDSVETISKKFPNIEEFDCGEIQEKIYENSKMGCAQRRLKNSYQVLGLGFIVDFHFLKASRSLAQISLFSTAPYTGENSALVGRCKKIERHFEKQYGASDYASSEVSNSPRALFEYNSSWKALQSGSRFELTCQAMLEDEAIIAILIRPVNRSKTPRSAKPEHTRQ